MMKSSTHQQISASLFTKLKKKIDVLNMGRSKIFLGTLMVMIEMLNFAIWAKKMNTEIVQNPK